MAAWRDSGIACSDPMARATRVTSSTNSGLPSARSTMAATSCGRSGAASVASMTSRSTTSDGSGPSETVSPIAGENPPVAPRRTAITTQGRAAVAVAMRSSRCADAMSAQCASSAISTSGPGTSRSDQVDQHVGAAIGAELRVDRIDLGRRWHDHMRDVGDERSQRQHVGCHLAQRREELLAHRLGLRAADAAAIGARDRGTPGTSSTRRTAPLAPSARSGPRGRPLPPARPATCPCPSHR